MDAAAVCQDEYDPRGSVGIFSECCCLLNKFVWDVSLELTTSGNMISAERLAVAPEKWKPEFKKRRYRLLPLASCSLVFGVLCSS